MKTLFIVQGNTGEYSDRCDWLVRAFFDPAKADALRDQLNAKCAELGLAEGANRRDRLAEVAMKSLDPQFYNDYTGTEYVVITCEMGDE